MLAYNQFSTSTTLQSATVSGQSVAAGGFGRMGAQKIVILETDGMVNQASTATFINAGAYNSYYNLPRWERVSASGSGRRHLGAERRHADLRLDHDTSTAQALPRRRCPS